jgi:hypothetical protein
MFPSEFSITRTMVSLTSVLSVSLVVCFFFYPAPKSFRMESINQPGMAPGSL